MQSEARNFLFKEDKDFHSLISLYVKFKDLLADGHIQKSKTFSMLLVRSCGLLAHYSLFLICEMISESFEPILFINCDIN